MKRSMFLVLGTMALMLSACGNKTATENQPVQGNTGGVETTQGNTAAGDTTSSDGTMEIKSSWWGGDSRHEATERAIAAFMEKYPDIRAIPGYGAWTGWEEKQSLNITGGNAADVMQINWNWIESYSQGGTSFANLEDYSDVLNLSQFPQESLELYRVDGKLIAVSVAMTGRLFYRNKTTSEEVECPIPTDMDPPLVVGAAFQAYNEKYYPLTLQEYGRAIFLVYYLESVYNKPWMADRQLNYMEAEIQEGLEFLCKLEAEHAIPTLSVASGDMADSINKSAKWIDGKYADIFEQDSSATKMRQAMEGSLNKPGQEFVIGDLVKFGDYQDGFTKISMGLAVAGTSAHPREATMLIEFLLNDPEGIEISSIERGTSCSAKAVEVLNEKGIDDELVRESNEKVINYPKFLLDAKFEYNDLKASPDGVYYKVFGKLSSGETDAAQAAKQLMGGVTGCPGS